MIRGFFYKFNRSLKNLQNVIFHVKLLPPTLRQVLFDIRAGNSNLAKSLSEKSNPAMY